ncbi:MAG: hypothetical protein QM811_06795 [Pirellulales bacterium]
MKAYKVSCRDYDHSQVIEFAKRSKDVPRNANAENCDCPYIEKRVTRAPEFDKYAPGPVTTQNCIDEGWQYECAGCCGTMLDNEHAGLIVLDSGHVYCGRECMESDYKRSEAYTHPSFETLRQSIRGYLERNSVTTV